MKQLHVVIYSELKPYGGGRETWLQYFLNGVCNKYEKIYVYGIKQPNDKEENLIEKSRLDIESFYVEQISVTKFVKRVKSELRKNLKQDDTCLMIGSVVEGMLAPWIKWKYKDKVKRIIWVRSIGAHEIANRHNAKLYPFISMIEKINLDSVHKVITNGHDTFDYYKQYWKREKGRLNVVTNAVNLNEFMGLKRWEYIGPLKCVFIGRLEKIKGVDILLDAISLFNENHPSLKDYVTFEFWGEGALKNSIKNDNIVFNGKAERSQVPQILNGAHVEFFIADLNENGIGGLSHSLLEGMAAECLCVCTGIPAYKQIVNDSNGLIVENQTVEELNKIIFNIVTSYKMEQFTDYIQKARTAKETVQEHSVDKHIERFLKIAENCN